MAKNKTLDLRPEERELRELEAHERHQKLMTYLRATGHRMPRTRREFLGSGLLAGVGYVAAPSILELIMRSANAHAQAAGGDLKCPDETASTGMIPFVHLNLSGGAALMGSNFVVHDVNGDPLPNYSLLGLGSPNNFSIVREFGNVPFAALNGQNVLISKFLEGMRNGAANADQANNPTAFANTAFVGVCVRSGDDTSNNPLSAMGLVTAAGLQGSVLPNMGTRGSEANSGVGQNFATVRGPAPLVVRNFNDINSAFAPTGTLNQQLPTQEMRVSLFKLVQNLSNSQKEMLAASSSSATLGKLVECATGKNVSLVSSTDNGVDPRTNAAVATIWQQAANTNNADTVRAALVFNALNGKAGSVGIDIGGYDYHGQGRANQETRDREAGTIVGRILRTAEVMGRPVFIYVTSDGSVNTNSADPGSPPLGDRGSAGGNYMIAYNPSGRPQTNGFQLGSFGNGQAADESIVPNWNPERSTLAVFANYLKLNNKLALLDSLANQPFDAGQLTRLLKF